jgi:hypothetical protein
MKWGSRGDFLGGTLIFANPRLCCAFPGGAWEREKSSIPQKNGSAISRPKKGGFPREKGPSSEIGFYERRELPRKHPMYPLEKVADSRKTRGKRRFSTSENKLLGK